MQFIIAIGAALLFSTMAYAEDSYGAVETQAKTLVQTGQLQQALGQVELQLIDAQKALHDADATQDELQDGSQKEIDCNPYGSNDLGSSGALNLNQFDKHK